eukprot:Blabericola_migrator_1__7697@NODE_392_length_9038_cov_131_832349_g80_i1_p5_GENE_NODE_392_length_9038_cov_131_832349_g80_i1NODE_392_length_9038_cov_131_832349_g80_i1_p5_ORF_typecomplete_len203_score32_642OGFeII_Oxy_2/PF13532_6/7e053HBOH/PF10605_9/0_18_NODE_392_length_9038_cov_131_832349_g80_i164007008
MLTVMEAAFGNRLVFISATRDRKSLVDAVIAAAPHMESAVNEHLTLEPCMYVGEVLAGVDVSTDLVEVSCATSAEALEAQRALKAFILTTEKGEVPLCSPVKAQSLQGVSLREEFVTAAEEEALMRFVDSKPWQTSLRRRVQHYGYRFDYKSLNVINEASGEVPVVPDELLWLIERVQATGLVSWKADQVTINEYLPGERPM